MAATDPTSDHARVALRDRLTRALERLDEAPPAPIGIVDLDAFDANADDLARRAAGTPIRVASKSLRIPALIGRALEHRGFSGILAYTLREALWLVHEGLSDDVVLAYPTVDPGALARLSGDDRALAAITVMVDDRAHLDLIDSVRPGGAPVRVAIDVDAGLRLGRAHLGPKRSPLYEPSDVLALARDVVSRPGLALVGVMTYEGQVAGVADDVPRRRAKSLAVRQMKATSLQQLEARRGAIAHALRELTELEFWNAGGSGSVETSAADPVVTEVAAGSALLAPHLFDHYRAFSPTPAAFFGVPVVRRPSLDIVTVAGGGLVASGPAGRDRLPLPWSPPGLHLTGLEGAGEVQTPLTGPGAAGLAIGDLVWFRHAKAGELAEHLRRVHLVRRDAVTDIVRTYRGYGLAW